MIYYAGRGVLFVYEYKNTRVGFSGETRIRFRPRFTSTSCVRKPTPCIMYKKYLFLLRILYTGVVFFFIRYIRNLRASSVNKKVSKTYAFQYIYIYMHRINRLSPSSRTRALPPRLPSRGNDRIVFPISPRSNRRPVLCRRRCGRVHARPRLVSNNTHTHTYVRFVYIYIYCMCIFMYTRRRRSV